MQATIAPPAPTLDAYQLRLSVFEGPLDVLLRLIEREQLPISQVSLLAVLDQFLAFTRQLESSRPEVVAEFAVIAGRLSLLKSRALLPRPAKSPDEADVPDLVRQLEEYRALKHAAAVLGERQQSGLGAFGRGEGVSAPDAESLPLPPQPPSALARAMKRWLSRAPVARLDVPTLAVVTLGEMTARVLSALTVHKELPFARVRQTCVSRQDVAVAFLAILTLLRRQQIAAVQEEVFGPITLIRTGIARIDDGGGDSSGELFGEVSDG